MAFYLAFFLLDCVGLLFMFAFMFGNVPMKAAHKVLQQGLHVILLLNLKTDETAECIQHTMSFQTVSVMCVACKI